MKFACPACGQRLEAETEMAGRQISCPVCATAVTIPDEVPIEARLENSSQSQSNRTSPAGETPVAEEQKHAAPTPASRIRTVALVSALSVLLVLLAVGGVYLSHERTSRAKDGPRKSGLFSPFKHAELAELKVFPAEVNLTTRQDRQSLVVQAIYADGITRDVTSEASSSLANPALAKISQQVLYPLADGKTELHVKFQGRALTLPVSVEQAKVERPISFKMDVMPVFMKAGCNSGSCHGSSRGKY